MVMIVGSEKVCKCGHSEAQHMDENRQNLRPCVHLFRNVVGEIQGVCDCKNFEQA